MAAGCRTPPGVRGLKLHGLFKDGLILCRTPPGVRGLKLEIVYQKRSSPKSHPAWGAWIETTSVKPRCVEWAGSHPAWGAWIET